MSSSPIGKAIDSQFRGTEFDSPKMQKKTLEPDLTPNPFAADLYTWDYRKQCAVTPDHRSFFGMGLARRCVRCERLKNRDANQDFRDWELEQYEKWLEARK